MKNTEHPSQTEVPPQGKLIEALRQALQETIFSSTRRIPPGQIGEIAQQISDSFLEFIRNGNERAVSLWGQQLVQEGISPRGILSMAEAIRKVCWETSQPPTKLLPVSGRYVGALLEGYMATREAFVLRQQDQIRRAFERALEQSKT